MTRRRGGGAMRIDTEIWAQGVSGQNKPSAKAR
jgi:hypothetical protein